MTLYEHVRLNSKQSGSRLLVLLFIASHLDAGRQPTHAQLAQDSRMSVRQVTRIVDALELSGELKVDRSGGHVAHRYSIESDNVDILSTLEKRQHGRFTAERRGDAVGETDPANVDNLSTLSDSTTLPSCHVNMSTLPPNVDKMATSNVDKLSGTPVAPSKAKNTSTEREANASRAAGAVSLQAYIGRLIQFRESELGTKLPNQQAEAAAAKWMHGQGWPEEDVKACYRFLVGGGKGWRQRAVTLNEVKSQIADWKKGNLSDGKRTEPRPAKPTREETYSGYDYSPLDGAEGEGGGRPDSEIPADEWVELAPAGRPSGDDRRVARSSRH